MWGVVLPYSIKGEQKCMLLPLLGGTALLPSACASLPSACALLPSACALLPSACVCWVTCACMGIHSAPLQIVLDEGHRIKDSRSQLSCALSLVHTRRRIVLTGSVQSTWRAVWRVGSRPFPSQVYLTTGLSTVRSS